MKPKWGGLFVLVSLAGCMVGPDYREPVPVVPNRWQAGRDPAAGLKPVDPQSLKAWWRSFGDAQLDRLMAQALAGNLDLKIALTRIDQARAQRRGTRAELFPQFRGRANAGRFDNPLPGIVPTSTRFNLFELGFDASFSSARRAPRRSICSAACGAGWRRRPPISTRRRRTMPRRS